MDIYNTLCIAVADCMLIPRYKVLIALNREDIKDLYKTLGGIIDTIDESLLYKHFYSSSHNQAIIDFKNGSEIKVVEPNESSTRGYRFNTLIIDDVLKSSKDKKDTIDYMLMPNLRPYSIYDNNGNFNYFKKYVESKIYHININNKK